MSAATGDHADAGERPVEEMSYAQASAELDAIVGFFEGREVDVDQLVGRLVRATAIIEELDKRLRRTRVQVEQLVPRLTAVLEETDDDDGIGVTAPDDEPEAAPAHLAADDGTAVAGRPSRTRDDLGAALDDGDDDTPGLF